MALIYLRMHHFKSYFPFPGGAPTDPSTAIGAGFSTPEPYPFVFEILDPPLKTMHKNIFYENMLPITVHLNRNCLRFIVFSSFDLTLNIRH